MIEEVELSKCSEQTSSDFHRFIRQIAYIHVYPILQARAEAVSEDKLIEGPKDDVITVLKQLGRLRRLVGGLETLILTSSILPRLGRLLIKSKIKKETYLEWIDIISKKVYNRSRGDLSLPPELKEMIGGE